MLPWRGGIFVSLQLFHVINFLACKILPVFCRFFLSNLERTGTVWKGCNLTPKGGNLTPKGCNLTPKGCNLEKNALFLKKKSLFFVVVIVILLSLQRQTIGKMKRLKVIEVIRLLEADGWELCYTRGDHRQFKHPTKPGKVTVRGKKSEVLSQFILNSIWKQAGWK